MSGCPGKARRPAPGAWIGRDRGQRERRTEGQGLGPAGAASTPARAPKGQPPGGQETPNTSSSLGFRKQQQSDPNPRALCIVAEWSNDHPEYEDGTDRERHCEHVHRHQGSVRNDVDEGRGCCPQTPATQPGFPGVTVTGDWCGASLSVTTGAQVWGRSVTRSASRSTTETGRLPLVTPSAHYKGPRSASEVAQRPSLCGIPLGPCATAPR